jgi:hypothetical protein
MRQLFQDTMAITRVFGNATFFITVTANPAWSEVVNALLHGQTASDRPDLIVRVFREKLCGALKIFKISFGNLRAHVYIIEFQKRGLPHTHMLLWIDPQDAPRTPEDMDKVRICS